MFADAIKGVSAQRRDRALRLVIEERNSCFANRIAQTELARERDGAERSCLRRLRVDEAARVMESRDKLQ